MNENIEIEAGRLGARSKWLLGRGLQLATVLTLGLAATGCPAKPDKAQAAVDIDLRRLRVDLLEDEYALGGDKALVTIVIWSDYACPPCGRSWQVMKHLVEDYGEDLRVVFRAGTVPGFAHGERASEAAFAAGAQGKFWDMHWRLFEHPDDFSRPVLRKHAEAIGLDLAQFMDDLDTGRFAGRRIRDRRASMELGVSALPVAFVNGLYVLGFKDEAGWHALIDREIATAKQMMQEGIRREGVYDEFMRTAKRGSVDEDSDEAKRLRAQREAQAKSAKPAQLASPAYDQRYAIPTGAPGFGPEDAPVVMVEFIDYQCPYCQKAQQEVIPALLERYPEDLRIELRHLPLEIHPSAPAAARAVITAGAQGKAAEFSDALWHRGADQGLGLTTFVAVAKQIGIDADRFERDFQTREIGEQLMRDVLLARRLGVQGTPGFFVNGRYVDGARSLGTFTDMIDEELASAEKLAEQGTARADLREALMRGALEPEQFPNAQLDTSGAAQAADSNPENSSQAPE
ncbi:thioredoxin domain-containing protein [Pseudenhygromyxa sp. WMMC2535]|uniref:DsbA family protein n=1 Tax=Pseudenhygromyxa sp. WMMC2535 TaxID=2712867 RepID=UPI001554CA15|nr:thioredoxin domain-containing protein [Pseudenhygromyxa sp. WMMC2535]NVB36568.1 thioredoxin domain-containing protein [Pseudenhygromyxa sp. WMMC2535]